MSGSNLEFNKLLAAVLVAGLIALGAGKVAYFLYPKEESSAKRGFEIEVAEESASGAAKPKEEEIIDIAALMASASADKGKKVAKKCMSCHDFDKGGKHKVGPALWGVMGAPIASKADYNYSSALREKGGEWNYDAMFAFLKSPKRYVKGTKMSFGGLRKPEQIADIMAYMRQHSDTTYPLPAPQQ